MLERCARAAFERAMKQPYGDVTRQWDDLGDGKRHWLDTTAAVIEELIAEPPAEFVREMRQQFQDRARYVMTRDQGQELARAMLQSIIQTKGGEG